MGSVMTFLLWVMYSTISLSAARFTSFHFRSLSGSDRKSNRTQHCRSFWMKSFSCSAGATSAGTKGRKSDVGQRAKRPQIKSGSVWFCNSKLSHSTWWLVAVHANTIMMRHKIKVLYLSLMEFSSIIAIRHVPQLFNYTVTWWLF